MSWLGWLATIEIRLNATRPAMLIMPGVDAVCCMLLMYASCLCCSSRAGGYAACVPCLWVGLVFRLCSAVAGSWGVGSVVYACVGVLWN